MVTVFDFVDFESGTRRVPDSGGGAPSGQKYTLPLLYGVDRHLAGIEKITELRGVSDVQE
jgi:hypothetical protein